MDLFKLDQASHQPTKVVEGYTSLIWTERYSDAGEFSLKTSLVNETEMLLTRGSMIGILQSNEVMIVESHSVETDDTGGEELTISGRSFETVLESRAMIYNDDPVSSNYASSTPGVYLADLINTKIASTTAAGVVQATLPEEGLLHTYAVDTTGQVATIPEQPFPDPSPGDVFSVTSAILKQYELGIRAARPPAGGQDLILVIYAGQDRTSTSGSPVAFNFQIGDLVDYSYLTSLKTLKNVAYVRSPIGFKMVYSPGTPSNISGMDRRVLQVDASDLTDEGNLTVDQALEQRGQKELAKYNGTSLLDGEISEESEYKYGVHYVLGDKILILGKEGVSNVRRVTEYVRSEDENGEKAYPTLAEVSS